MLDSAQEVAEPAAGARLRGRRAGLLVAASPVCNATVAFLTTGMLAQILTFESFGLYLNWVYAASILAMGCSFGLPAANAYAAAKAPWEAPRIRGYSLAATLAAGAAGAAILYGYVSRAADPPPQWAAVSLALTVPASAALSSLNGVFLGSRRNHCYLLFAGLPVWVQFATLAAVWLTAAPAGLALPLALASYAAGFAVALGALCGSADPVARPDAAEFHRAMGYALPLWIHSIFTVLVQRFDVLLLSHMLPPVEIGMFALATKLADVLSYPPQGLGLAMFTSFVQSGTEEAFRILGASIRLYLVFGGLAGLVAWVGCAFVLPVYVPKVESAVPLLPLLLGASILLGPLYLLCSFCQALGQSSSVLAITTGAFLIKLAFLLPLTAWSGLRAAPPAVLAGAFFALLAALAVAARVAGQRAAVLLVPRRHDWRLVRELVGPLWRSFRYDRSLL